MSTIAARETDSDWSDIIDVLLEDEDDCGDDEE
jgi:hypothetical protein